MARSWTIGIVVVLLLLGVAAAWKWTDLALYADPDRISNYLEPLRSRWYGLPVVVAIFVVAELVLFPVLVLVLVCGMAFGPVLGPVYALAGSMASAIPPFLLGRKLGRARVERLGGALVKRIAASLEGRGLIAVFLVRKVPAPYTLVNLVCGASPVSLRDFLLGTLLGMGTGVILLTVVGAQLLDLIRDPRPWPMIGSVALLFAPLLIALVIQRFINRRQVPIDRESGKAQNSSRSAPEAPPAPEVVPEVVSAAAASRAPTASDGIMRPGDNCWRIERAERFRCVQDGEEFFRLVRGAILAARRTVFILGWDVYAATDLAPGSADAQEPTRLADLLDFVARRNPELQVYVLIWDYAALYVFERDPTSRIRLGLATHERVHFRFDDLHPLGASHHQKVIVIDDRLAFSGGLDLTSHRWDVVGHPITHPLRLGATGEPYTPFHDVQALVEGPVAASLGELARARWSRIGVNEIPPLAPRIDSIWPESDAADLEDVDVAIARTDPTFRGREGVRECEALFHDEIAAARRVIYAENQYFTNAKIGEALAKRLREPDGPEVIIVGPRECSGWLEQRTIGALRHRVLLNLIESDHHGRLRLLWPIASRQADVDTFVHSKVLVIDDVHLRIGSANLSSRSMGMDTECDVIAVAGDDPVQRRGIERVRNRLVGEHLSLDADAVAQAIEQHGSLRGAIDALSGGDHTLEKIVVDCAHESQTLDALGFAIDPDEPMALSRTIDRLLPALEVDDARKSRRLIFVAACVAGVFAIAAQSVSGVASLDASSARELLETVSADYGAARWIFAALIAGGLLFVPVELLVLVPVVLLGPVRGGAMSVVAALLCASAGYLVGRALGPTRVAPLIPARSRSAWRGLGRDGALPVAVVLFMSLFSATSVHVMCGAARVRIRNFVLGSVLGLAPAFLASLILGTFLRGAILDPSPTRSVVTIFVALLLAVVALRVRRIVLMRAHGRALSDQRTRALRG